MLKIRSKQNSGFTLIELAGAIFIIAVGVLAAFMVVQQSTHQTRNSMSQLIASYLAQEGIEIVRNIRDQNYINNLTWNNGLANDGSYEAGYNDSGLSPWVGKKLRISSNAPYRYNYGSIGPTNPETQFSREIILTNQTDYLEVKVKVSWNGGVTLVQENIYNWR